MSPINMVQLRHGIHNECSGIKINITAPLICTETPITAILLCFKDNKDEGPLVHTCNNSIHT